MVGAAGRGSSVEVSVGALDGRSQRAGFIGAAGKVVELGKSAGLRDLEDGPDIGGSAGVGGSIEAAVAGGSSSARGERAFVVDEGPAKTVKQRNLTAGRQIGRGDHVL